MHKRKQIAHTASVQPETLFKLVNTAKQTKATRIKGFTNQKLCLDANNASQSQELQLNTQVVCHCCCSGDVYRRLQGQNYMAAVVEK